MHRNSANVSTKQERIATLAKQSPQMAFTSLAYLMDIEWLHEAYRRTRKDGAVGVDGVTAEEYEQDLEGNLQSLLDRAKSGTYKAPPVRRVHIPKGGSSTETRPIGIPTLEDKLLQRAIVMLLEPIYEQDFLDCSYGFRPGRKPHDALRAFDKAVYRGEIKTFKHNVAVIGDGNAAFDLAPDQGREWHIIADVNHDSAALVRLQQLLRPVGTHADHLICAEQRGESCGRTSADVQCGSHR